jgi:glycogen synthase
MSLSMASTLLVEVAWEVCNQVGGIYTVLKSKAQAMQNRWGDRYLLVGPYEPSKTAIEFEEGLPHAGFLQRVLERGLPCHYGRWLIPGRPQVLLIDYRKRYHDLGKEKYFLWNDFGVSVPDEDTELGDLIAFNYGVASLLREMSEVLGGSNPSFLKWIIAHFHEWMAGMAIPVLRKQSIPISTVFTTHATLLGRYMAGDNPHFYDHLDYIDADGAARHYNIYPRYSIERLAARECDVFTTISDVTARESRQLLGRNPDVITPNGINLKRFIALHEFQNLHLKYKEKIHELVMGHFFPSYSFDLDRTLYFFTSGRYEYRNKGMDLFIEALYHLNERLKRLPDPPTIIAFLVTKAPVRNVNVEALQKHLMLDDLRSVCQELHTEIGQRVLQAVVHGRLPSYEELLPHEPQIYLKRAIHAFKSGKLPSIVTHDLVDDATDPVLQHLRHRNLINHPTDPVKVLFHPDFVTPASPLFRMEYDQFVRGCHLGVFPSYYEPWGYTPLECVALGIPTITTDLAGFGAFVQHQIPHHQDQGIYVLNRTLQGTGQSIDDLTGYLYQFTMLTRRERIELRNKVERLADVFDWSVLVNHYHSAHEEAFRAGINRHPHALEALARA